MVPPAVQRRRAGLDPRARGRTPAGKLRSPAGRYAAVGNRQEHIARFHRPDTPAEEPVETQPGVSCSRKCGRWEARPLRPRRDRTACVHRIDARRPGRACGSGRIAVPAPAGKGWPGARPDPGRVCDGGHRGGLCGAGRRTSITALAYGTQSVPKVAKIAGPGNVYVAAAKAEVSIDPAGTAIDLLAGPSELMVLADGSGGRLGWRRTCSRRRSTTGKAGRLAHQQRRVARRGAGGACPPDRLPSPPGDRRGGVGRKRCGRGTIA